jgi:tetrahydromethanopterin S-methyltransferase subunit C
MATTYKVLGQVNPSAGTATTAYTVPAGTQTVISTISVCNLGAAPTSYRIAVRPDAETLANKHYITYDAGIAPQETQTLTLGITVDATDVITVYAGTATMAFNLFGSEIA